MSTPQRCVPAFRHLATGVLVSLVFLLFLGACASPTRGEALRTEAAEKLPALATTTIVGDVVSQVGGELALVQVLLPPGADPHTFEPPPRDVAAVADAQLVFVNGAGLEPFLGRLGINPADERGGTLSEGIEVLQ